MTVAAQKRQSNAPQSATQKTARIALPTVYDVIGSSSDDELGVLARLLEEVHLGLECASAALSENRHAGEAMMHLLHHKAKTAFDLAEEMQRKGMSLEELNEPTIAATPGPTSARERFSCSLDLRECIGELGVVATGYANDRSDDVKEAAERVAKLVGDANYYMHCVEEELAEARKDRPAIAPPKHVLEFDELDGIADTLRVADLAIEGFIQTLASNGGGALTATSFEAVRSVLIGAIDRVLRLQETR